MVHKRSPHIVKLPREARAWLTRLVSKLWWTGKDGVDSVIIGNLPWVSLQCGKVKAFSPRRKPKITEMPTVAQSA